MPYLFTCPHCQTRTEVEDAYSGQSGECVVCGRPITLPQFASRSASIRGNASGAAKPKRPIAWVAAAVLLLLLVGAMVVAAVRVGGSTAQKLRQGRQRLASIRNLEKIASALNAYASDHGSYPPPMTMNEQGKPLHSWRVLILPYLGEEELYDQFDLDVPWDQGKNQTLVYSDVPSVYRHPDSQMWGYETAYCLVTGPGTLFPKSGPLSPKQATDGAAKTILVCEARLASQWNEPVDLDVVAAAGTINTNAGTDFGGVTDGGVCVATIDGRGHFMPDTTPPLTLNALITPQGGEPLQDDVLD